MAGTFADEVEESLTAEVEDELNLSGSLGAGKWPSPRSGLAVSRKRLTTAVGYGAWSREDAQLSYHFNSGDPWLLWVSTIFSMSHRPLWPRRSTIILTPEPMNPSAGFSTPGSAITCNPETAHIL